MGILIKILAIIGALAIIVVVTVTWKFHSAVNERIAEVDKEYAIVETADWFGKTGLDGETERELPRYLRREFGESMSKKGALKANDLVYLGVFQEPESAIHYWRIPSKNSKRESYFAYIEDSPDGAMGWGDKKPPQARIEK